MSNLTFASLFTGGGGADLGAVQAGLKPIWGVEINPKIAVIAKRNLDHKMLLGDINYINYSKLSRPDWLHASPPCVNASTANNGKETQEDVELAQTICRAIETFEPEYFSLENVAGYLSFDAFDLIFKKVITKYRFSFKSVLDCADYGIPQSRKRLFFVASNNDFSLFQKLELQKKRVSWHEAIADLIPTLPEWELTKSQKQRLYKSFPYDNPDLAIQNSGSRKDKNGNPKNTIRLANEPIWTIRAMSGNVRVNPHQVTLIIDGKVLRPSIQCYARWQGFPDDYQWSGDFKLDMKICGNAVPPKFFAQLIKEVIN